MKTKGHCYPKSMILQAVYLKLRFTLSYRDVEEIMKMRGVQVDHATIQRLVYKFTPFVELQVKKRKLRVGTSWRMDETYVFFDGVTVERFDFQISSKKNERVDSIKEALCFNMKCEDVCDTLRHYPKGKDRISSTTREVRSHLGIILSLEF